MTPDDYTVLYAPAGTSGTTPLVFPFFGTELALGPDGQLPSAAMLATLGPPLAAFEFAELADGSRCELRLWPSRETFPQGWLHGDFRRLWEVWPQTRANVIRRARQLAAWVMHNRFCGKCGVPMRLAEREPAAVCPACAHRVYPRLSPVVMGLVIRGEELLLGRAPRFAPGVFSALAGFVEAGESAEAALAREIREEAGVEIGRVRYFGSQSWPYLHSFMIGFFAEYRAGTLQRQEEELEDLAWFPRDRLPPLPHSASMAHRMILTAAAGAINF